MVLGDMDTSIHWGVGSTTIRLQTFRLQTFRLLLYSNM